MNLRADVEVNERGFWLGDEKDCANEHEYDASLSEALIQFFLEEGAISVADFGCGKGDYIKAFKKKGIYVKGYDGNPFTPQLTGGLGTVIDLSTSFDLEEDFDWVLSLEVGEHIPKEYMDIFIENLMKHNRFGIVLSWAVKGQGGLGHVNCQDNEFIKDKMEAFGYRNDTAVENRLRKSSVLPWFKNTIMVFRKT
jgi:SAM-dependent methyltransferase